MQGNFIFKLNPKALSKLTIILLIFQELREKFDQQKPTFILSAAFGCRKPDIDNGYEIEKISE